MLFLLPLVAWAGTLHVECRQSEVWLIDDGRARQLTHDGKSKDYAALSPSRSRIAYVESCPQAEQCTPSVVLLDLDGHRVRSFQPTGKAVPPEGPCGSILSMEWTGQGAIATEYHINPSLSEYTETDLSTDENIRDLLAMTLRLRPTASRSHTSDGSFILRRRTLKATICRLTAPRLTRFRKAQHQSNKLARRNHRGWLVKRARLTSGYTNSSPDFTGRPIRGALLWSKHHP
jgi:hypothetical protein